MGAYNLINRTLLQSGQPEDISQVVANLDAIATVLNGGIDNTNLKGAPSLAANEVAVWNGSAFARSTTTRPGATSLGSGTPSTTTWLRGDGSWQALATGTPSATTWLRGDGTWSALGTGTPDSTKYLRGDSSWQPLGTGTPDGTKFLRDDRTWQVPPYPASSAPTVGTTLPGSPTDGQQAILVDSVTLPTWALMFQYDASITDAYKWVYMGGTPIQQSVATQETTASSTFVDLTTVGPQITLPRAGTWRIELEAGCANTAAAYSISTVTGAGITASDEGPRGAQGNVLPSVATRTYSGLTATLYKMQYRVTGGTGQFERRFMRATPVRVS